MSFPFYRPDKVTLSRLARIGSFITIQAPIGAGKSWLLASLSKVIDDMGISAKNIQPSQATGESTVKGLATFSWTVNENGERELRITQDTSQQNSQLVDETEPDKSTEAPEQTKASARRHAFIIIKEPVEGWTGKSYSVAYKDGSIDTNDFTNFPSINEEGKANILQLFGDNMKIMGLPFQICAFTSRIQLIAEELGKIDQSIFDDPSIQIHIISERSVTTDRLFFKNLYDNNMVKNYEWEIYNSFYNIYCEELLEKENIMLYLNTSVDKCSERIKLRGRVEEKNLSRDYLEALDVAHKKMIKKVKENPKRKVFEVDFESEFHSEDEVYEVSHQLLTKTIGHIDGVC